MLHVSIWISRSGTSIPIECCHGWINVMSVSSLCHRLILSNKCQTAQWRCQGVHWNSWLSWSDGTISNIAMILSETWSEIVIVFVRRHFTSKCEAVDCSNRRGGARNGCCSRISKVTINPDFSTTSMIFMLFGGFVDGFDDWGHWRVGDAGLISWFAGVFPPSRLGAVNGSEWA